ncbi:MAG: hypothetical protein IH614_02475 [Desulfuromonadales bacterium]|nr:hypothetical protein [Desulfuromonadales bacterium]
MKWFKDDGAQEHDRQLYLQAEAIMGETDFDYFFDTLRTDRAYYTANRGRLLNYLKMLDSDEFRLHDRRLQARLLELQQALKDLKAHTGAHFLAFPRNQTGDNIRFCLHPDYFILEANDVSLDEHGFYLKAERKLGEYVAKAVIRYEAFRTLAKKKLKP